MVIKKRNLYRGAVLSLLILFIGIFIIPSAVAGSISDFPQYMLKTVNTGVARTIQDALTPTKSNGEVNKFYKLMVGDWDPSSNTMTGLSKGISVVMNATMGVAMLSVLIITMVRLFQDLDKGADVKESVYKSLVTLFLTGIVVLNLGDVLSLIVKIGEWLMGVLTDLAEDPGDLKITLKQITGKDKGGIIWWIQCFAILIIPWIFSLIMSLVAKFMSFSILLELGIRKAFAPFAVVDIYSEGMRSPGVRYLKRYLATFLKIVIALLAAFIGAELMVEAMKVDLANDPTIGDVFTYILETFAINLTILGAITKSGEYTNDIVGV